MNFIELESAQKLRGGFYTDPSIAAFLVKWIRACNPTSLLEPSCGDGVFLSEIERQGVSSLNRITACELDEEEAEKAKQRTNLPVNVLKTDFLRWSLFCGQDRHGFDAVVGNPPFVRYQYMADEQQRLAGVMFSQLGLPFTKHTNMWVPFVLASVRLLAPGGRLAMVVPSELFHIPHAQSLRRYLAQQCERILVLDPSEIWFNDTLQGTVLLLAQKKQDVNQEGRGVAVCSVGRDDLLGDPEVFFQEATYTNGVTIEGKWMPVFLSDRERSLVADLKARKEVAKFSDIASVDVGIVTGANKFFLVSDSTVKEFALQRWAHPMFGRSAYVKGIVYTDGDHKANTDSGLATNFLWFDEGRAEDLPPGARKYLDIGLSQMLQARFKCRNRKPWYRVPSVYSAPISMLKRAHHYPRLVLNTANVLTTDTAYRIRPIGVEPEALVLSFVNSLTCLCAEMEGRHYGGGVLELVPSEIERLPIPQTSASAAELDQADSRFRIAKDDCEFLRIQDTIVLSRIGVSRDDQETLHGAWLRLRNRRHRVCPSEAPDESLESV